MNTFSFITSLCNRIREHYSWQRGYATISLN